MSANRARVAFEDDGLFRAVARAEGDLPEGCVLRGDMGPATTLWGLGGSTAAACQNSVCAWDPDAPALAGAACAAQRGTITWG
jgi:hypothetical protein